MTVTKPSPAEKKVRAAKRGRDKELTLHERILGIMERVKYIRKGGTTDRAAGGYKYVKHDDVTATLRKAMVEFGVLTVTHVEEQSLNTLSYKKSNGAEVPMFVTEVKLSVEFVNADKPTDRIGVTSIGYGMDRGDKGPGKAISYAFKYALLKTFMLETGDDVEATSPQMGDDTPAQRPTPEPGGPPQASKELATMNLRSMGLLAEQVGPCVKAIIAATGEKTWESVCEFIEKIRSVRQSGMSISDCIKILAEKS